MLKTLFYCRMQQLDEMVQVADKTIPTPTAPLIAASSSKPLVAVSPVANTTSGQSASTIPPVSAVPTKSGSGSTEKTHVSSLLGFSWLYCYIYRLCMIVVLGCEASPGNNSTYR